MDELSAQGHILKALTDANAMRSTALNSIIHIMARTHATEVLMRFVLRTV